MCEPATILMVGATIAAGAGTGMQMYGQAQEGKAIAASHEYNALMKERQADSVGEQAAFDARQLNDDQRRAVAAGQVSAAASGIDIASGAVLDWEGDMLEAATLDTAAIYHNARLQQFGLRSGATLDRHSAKNARTAAKTNMYSTAFSSGARIAGSWANFQQAGT